MELSTLLPLVALILGFVLSELSWWLRTRRSDRGNIGRALSELLEIRHRLRGMHYVNELMIKKMKMPEDFQPELRLAMEKMLPAQEKLSERFDEAVSEISKSNPLLSFELRSKELMASFTETLMKLADAEGNERTQLYMRAVKIEKILLGKISRSIRSLAWQYGIATYVRTILYLWRELRLPVEVDAILTEQKTIGREAMRSESID